MIASGSAAVATVQERLGQWQHNRDFVQTIEPQYSDWIVTASPYLSLHAVEALLTADRARPRSSHTARLLILQSEQRYLKIHVAFKQLYDLAHVTRYSAQRGRWLPAVKVEQKVVHDLVYPIEASVRKLLAASQPPIAAPPFTPIVLRPAIPPTATIPTPTP